MSAKNLKHLLIFIPKCIELNSESKPKLILVLGLALGIIQDPDPITFFWRNVWLQLVIGVRIRLIGNVVESITELRKKQLQLLFIMTFKKYKCIQNTILLAKQNTGFF